MTYAALKLKLTALYHDAEEECGVGLRGLALQGVVDLAALYEAGAMQQVTVYAEGRRRRVVRAPLVSLGMLILHGLAVFDAESKSYLITCLGRQRVEVLKRLGLLQMALEYRARILEKKREEEATKL